MNDPIPCEHCGEPATEHNAGDRLCDFCGRAEPCEQSDEGYFLCEDCYWFHTRDELAERADNAWSERHER